MEGDGHSETVEWIVENFSCWNNAIHGECLRERLSGFALYPRGLNGDGENLVLRISEPFHPIEGELSFVSSNGSILSKTVLNETHKQGDHVVVSGPKYREIIAQAKNEASHKDTLTLRCTLKKDFDKKYYGHTAIDVYDTFLKIPGEAFKDLEQYDSKLLSTMRYTLDVNKEEIEIVASATGSTSKDCKISFKFIPKSCTGDVLIRTYISVQNSYGVVIKSEENDYLVLNNTDHKFADLVDRKVLESGCTILFRIKLIGGVKREVCYISEPFVNYYKNIPQNQNTLISIQLLDKSVDILLQELMCLYQDQEFSDFEFHCENIIFPTHRSILSARSPVFKTMLSNDMREAASRSMDITDLDPHTLGRFLIFLYTGIVKDLTWKSALTLYYAADKYQVPSLKDECSSVLRSKVSISNVCDILSLAEKHQDEGLHSAAHKFILENYNGVLRSDEWESYMEKDPYLLLKTLTSISKKSNVGKIEVKPKIPLTQSTPLQFNFGMSDTPVCYRPPTHK